MENLYIIIAFNYLFFAEIQKKCTLYSIYYKMRNCGKTCGYIHLLQ